VRFRRFVAAVASVATGTVLWVQAAPPAAAATRTFPGTAPCDTTLQGCIDGVPGGTTIAIKTGTYSGDLDIKKKLKLKPAPGAKPTIAGNVLVGVPFSNQTINVELTGLRIDGKVDVTYSGTGSGHRFSLRNSEIWSTNEYGVILDGNSPASFVVEDNTISSIITGIRVSTLVNDGMVDATLRRNLVEGIGNSHDGIWLGASGLGGVLRATVESNVIRAVAGCNCDDAGIRLGSSNSAQLIAGVTNNTIDQVQSSNSAGIEVATPLNTSRIDAYLYNNIVSSIPGNPVLFPAYTQQLWIGNDYNNFFNYGSAPQYGGYASGQHTYNINPQYVSPGTGDYRLQSSSPLRNLGYMEPPLGLGLRDYSGKARIAEAIVDIGALEFGASAACTYMGTPGSDTLLAFATNDIVCGLGGNDVILAGPGNDKLTGGAGNDRLYAGKGADVLLGKGGKDLLEARDKIKNNDRMSGGSGSDKCNGDTGDDKVSC
jgi:Ca2+-binding RTX toxin-like protein